MNCLKGLPTMDLIWGKTFKWKAFRPPSSEQPDNEGWYRSSINWEENESDERPLNHLLHQPNQGGDIQFKAGVVRVPRNSIDRIIEQHEIEDKLMYEEEPLEGNEFHGNLMFHQKLISSREDKAQICTALARAVVRHIPQPGE